MAILAGCAVGQGSLPGSLPPPARSSPTAFRPVEPSPTPTEIRLLVSPEVPPSLQQTLVEVAGAARFPLQITTIPEQADVRLEPHGDARIATWTYALTAAFPTVEDGLSTQELALEWGRSDGETILVRARDLPALRFLLGPPGPSVQVVDDEASLVDRAWATRPSHSIVPFEDLDVRLKVLSVDGVSVLGRGADLSGYPLQLDFGLSGSAEGVERVRSLLEAAGTVPVTNRRLDRMTVVVVTGVTALTRATAWQMDRSGMTFPARDIGDWLRQADITHISNEVSFAESCPDPIPDQRVLRFCSSPRHIQLLEDVGTDVVELTGNHVLDAGPEAFLNSLELYRARGWAWFGGGVNVAEAVEPARFEHNGNRIAFLGCNEAGPVSSWASEETPGATPCGPERLTPQIKALRQEGYLPIFTFQWHEHYVPRPPASQREAFTAVARAGAVAVSGSQAHQPQGFGFEGQAFIHYGLGNLFFDQMWSNDVRQEFIDRYVFYDGRLISVELLTAYLEDWSRPRPMTPEERANFLHELFAASGW